MFFKGSVSGKDWVYCVEWVAFTGRFGYELEGVMVSTIEMRAIFIAHVRNNVYLGARNEVGRSLWGHLHAF